MRKNFVLVDYENVQPKDLSLLHEGPFQVTVFLGPNQAKVPVGLAAAMQPLGANGNYILLESGGPDALDFHIAYYIGVLSAEHPDAFFHIISKDTGFDPLIKHLKHRKVYAHRSPSIPDMPYFKPQAPVVPEEQVKAVIADLVRRKASKPRTQKTLLNTMNALMNKALTEQQLNQLFGALCSRGIVKLEGTKVNYKLPGAGE